MRTLIGQKIGDYEIVSELGRGAMGVVYKARQYSLDRPVALKVLAPDLARDESYIERFKREAILAATIIHPNIVSVYEAETHMDLDSGERVHYFVMEYIEGETVQRRLTRQDRIPADEVAAIGVRIAQGLECAWRKARIIHRDIKPSNIFLTRSGDVKVADLGLARVAGDAQASLTATGAIIGTAYYMSPEQVRGESDLDFRSDIYSLGCTLYRMLCGQHLYEGAFASVIVKHLTEPPPSIRMVMPDCPVAIVKVMEKMLAKHPTRRRARGTLGRRRFMARAARRCVRRRAGLSPMLVARATSAGVFVSGLRFPCLLRAGETREGETAMKRLFAITIITMTGLLLPAAAQVRLEVKPLTSKKDVGGGYGNASDYVQSRSLAINIQNTSAKPLLGVIVRWGIVKMNQGGYASNSSNAIRPGQNAAFGGVETVDLKPLENKRIETAAVEAGGRRWNYLAPEGEKLVGHGVQVLIGDKVVAEEFVPPTVKNAFKELRPVGSDRAEDGKGGGKSRR